MTGTDTGHERSDGDVAGLARGGVANFAGALVQGLSGFVVVVLVSRGAGTGGVGAFLIAVALFNLASTLARLGADVGLVKFIASALALGEPGTIRAALRLAVAPVALVGALAGAVLGVAAGPLGELLGEGGQQATLAAHLRVLAPFVPVAAVHTVLIVATRGFAVMGPAVLVEKLGRSVVQVVGVGFAVWLDAEPVFVSAAWGGSYLLALVPGVVWLRRLVAAHPGAGPDVTSARAFWSFSGPRGAAAVLQIGLLWFDTLLLGALAGAGDAGIYAAATRYLLVGQFVQLAVVDVVQPMVGAALATRSTGAAQRLYQTGTGWQMSLAWPAYVTLGVFAPAFLAVFGPGFAAGSTALAILCVAMLIATGAGPVDAVLLMAGRSSASLANTAVAFALNVVLNLLLIPRWGIEGAAVAWLAALSARNVVALVLVARTSRLHPFGTGARVVAATALGVLAAVEIAVRMVLGPGTAGLAVGTVLAGAAYAAVLWRRREAVELPALAAALRRRGRTAAPQVTISGLRSS